MRKLLITAVALLGIVACQKDFYLEDLEAAQAEILLLERSQSTLTVQLNEAEAEVAILNNTAEQLNSVILELEDTISEIEVTTEAQELIINDLTAEAVALEAEIVTLTETIVEYQTEIIYLETEVVKYVNVASEISDIEDQVEDSQNALAQALANVNALTAEIAELTEINADLVAQLEALNVDAVVYVPADPIVIDCAVALDTDVLTGDWLPVYDHDEDFVQTLTTTTTLTYNSECVNVTEVSTDIQSRTIEVAIHSATVTSTEAAEGVDLGNDEDTLDIIQTTITTKTATNYDDIVTQGDWILLTNVDPPAVVDCDIPISNINTYGDWVEDFTNQTEDFTQTRVVTNTITYNEGCKDPVIASTTESREITIAVTTELETSTEAVVGAVNDDDDLLDNVERTNTIYTASHELGSYTVNGDWSVPADGDVVAVDCVNPISESTPVTTAWSPAFNNQLSTFTQTSTTTVILTFDADCGKDPEEVVTSNSRVITVNESSQTISSKESVSFIGDVNGDGDTLDSTTRINITYSYSHGFDNHIVPGDWFVADGDDINCTSETTIVWEEWPADIGDNTETFTQTRVGVQTISYSDGCGDIPDDVTPVTEEREVVFTPNGGGTVSFKEDELPDNMGGIQSIDVNGDGDFNDYTSVGYTEVLVSFYPAIRTYDLTDLVVLPSADF